MSRAPLADDAAEAIRVDPSPAWVASLPGRLDNGWHAGEWNASTWTFTGDPDNPRTWVFRCTIAGCPAYDEHQGPYCRRCRRNYIKQGHPADFAERFRPLRPPPDPDAGRVFSLADLPDQLRTELLFALQVYTRERVIVPRRVQRLVERLPADVESVLDVSPSLDVSLPTSERGLLRSLRGVLIRDLTGFDGTDVTLGDVWDCGLVGLVAGTHRNYTSALGVLLDFRPIHQGWLRELCKEYVRSTRPVVHKARPIVKACTIASQALLVRPDGDHPERLGYADITAVVDCFELLTEDDGRLTSPTHRSFLFSQFNEVVNFSRRSGLMDHVPGSFVVPAQLGVRRRGVEQSEDLSGRALPAHVVAQLDAHLHLLGMTSNFACVGWSADDLREMHRTIYQVLRDTGRRPEEVNSLKRDCVQWVDGKPSLIYDNHKARRLKRRLPIGESTAQIIEAWRERLDRLPITADSPWLFPAPGGRGQTRRGKEHIRGWGARTFRNWIDSIPAITDTGLDKHGLNVAFPRDKITPYAFRHTYAQRHADAGTPVDVLRQLMDHISIETTMGYYTVTMSRRRDAVTTVATMMVDRNGTRLPPVETVNYEMGTVAVPFGNCAEPSNVKAGGGHCPIRFQCAGCSFYRPDPSYLPALETHVAELRVNKEHALATDAAGWVVTNLQDQVDAFTTVAQAMRALLDELPQDERAAVEQAFVEVRKLRQLNVSMLGRAS